MYKAHQGSDNRSTNKATTSTMTPYCDRNTIVDHAELVDQPHNMAMANETVSLSSGASQEALPDTNSDDPNGNGAVMSSLSSDSHTSIFGERLTPDRNRYPLSSASLTEASTCMTLAPPNASADNPQSTPSHLAAADDSQVVLPMAAVAVASANESQSASVAVLDNTTDLQKHWRELPHEIKDKIFGFVDGPRMIEFERPPQRRNTGWLHIDHAAYQVSRKSRKPPLCFQLCSASRKEGYRKYMFLKFGSSDYACRIWFSVEDDIIWLGGNACARTLKGFLNDEDRVEIQNFAFSCNLGVDKCCAFDHGESSILQMLQGHTEEDEARDLHGPPHDDLIREFRGQLWLKGRRGLKHSYIVVSSRLCGNFGRPGQMRPEVCFRPAASNGLNRLQQWYRQKQERDFDKPNKGLGVHFTRETPWIGDKKPAFHFVSFAPQSAGTSYDAVVVDFPAGDALCRGNRAFIRDLQSTLGVNSRVTRPNSKDSDQQETGISGPWESVKLAKQAIKTHVDKGIGRYVETNNEGTLYRFCERCEDGFRKSNKKRM